MNNQESAYPAMHTSPQPHSQASSPSVRPRASTSDHLNAPLPRPPNRAGPRGQRYVGEQQQRGGFMPPAAYQSSSRSKVDLTSPPSSSSSNSLQPAWSQTWRTQHAPKAPPSAPYTQASTSYNPSSNPYGVTQRSNLFPPPPLAEGEAVVSATYIPGGESFGPGVGIPPLFPGQEQEPGFARDDSYYCSDLEAHDQRFFNGPSSALSSNSQPSAMKELPAFPDLDESELALPAYPQRSDSRMASHEGSEEPVVDPAVQLSRQWTLQNVLMWLDANGFSREWLETFRALGLCGADFLALGHARGTLGLMHQAVYPRLAREAHAARIDWDQELQRNEGRRLRQLVRRLTEPYDAASHPVHRDNKRPQPEHRGMGRSRESSPRLRDSPQSRRPNNAPSMPNLQLRTASPVRIKPGSNPGTPDAETKTSPVRPPRSGLNPGTPEVRMSPVHRKTGSTDSGRLDGSRSEPDSAEPLSSAKDFSKGFLDRFWRRKKDSEASPDESPTRPLSTSARSSAHGERLFSQDRVGRKYVLVTEDQATFRLIDISAIDTADDIRRALCGEGQHQLYMTELGQAEHDEPLTDEMLMLCRNTRADATGTLKIWVKRALPTNTVAAQDSWRSLRLARQSGAISEHDWGAWLTAAMQEHKAEVAKKRRPSRQKPPPLNVEAATMRSDKVINFDSPRKSPYDSDRQSLVPLRRPPAPPAGSQMLEKANSLGRRSGEQPAGTQMPDRANSLSRRSGEQGGVVGSRRRRFDTDSGLIIRQSSGPQFVFQDRPVQFEQPSMPNEEADSDDGLFAKPLAKAKRPMLKVNTEAPARNTRGRSVTFKTLDKEKSPTATKMVRRQSFMRDDVWASRPVAEDLLDNLDDFFPNLDLDQPVLEDLVPSPGDRPVRTTVYDRPESIAEETETLGSDESTLRSRAPMNSRKSTGLGRMKSIRDVARGAYDPAATQAAAKMARRKSTKMFGANIVQVKPGQGSRVSLVEAVPAAVPAHNSYQIARGQLIGKGSYGKVYLGINLTTGDFLAVKQVEISQKAAGNDKAKIREMVSALDQEIDTMQHLEHPNIVQYLGCERKEYSICIFLEYISGGSVGSCLRKHGKFEDDLVSSLTRQVLAGLLYLHQAGVLHRDLKADNILLDVDGTCKISDFGISKKSDNIYGNDVTNNMQGSVFWMAPEVVRSQGQGYSAKVDIWSLGCVVLEMFAGKRPWSKEEAIGAIYKLGSLNQAPPIPQEVSQAISAEALAFMLDCFTIDPSDRPTADTLLHQHPFSQRVSSWRFEDTELALKLRAA